ncbi:MAG TPA: T9SS type A sorting domain-containing protein, partial [Bacteroidales bacterium]|nr:T9SS type A sorting domain-containing protein [Bacteroidales bacterium]
DGEARQGKFHTSFRADSDGETMYLSQKVGGTFYIYDSVSFSLLVGDHSFGKYEDGTGNWQHMVNMTPGLPNDPDRLVYKQEISAITYDIKMYPNPSEGIINISIEEDDLYSKVYSMDVTDISGKVIYPQVWLNSNNSHINLTHIHNGLYFIRIFKNRQLVLTDKLIILK